MSSRYWNIWCISPASERQGYQNCLIPAAQAFAQNYSLDAQEGAVQSVLLSYFYGQSAPVTTRMQAQAGLCLRCYVSTAILKACQTIDHLFGSEKSFTYRDLLPFVLTDDGKTLVLLDLDRKMQQVVLEDGSSQVSTYSFFSVEVLRTFRAESQSRLSLDNWAFLRTKQKLRTETVPGGIWLSASE